MKFAKRPNLQVRVCVVEVTVILIEINILDASNTQVLKTMRTSSIKHRTTQTTFCKKKKLLHCDGVHVHKRVNPLNK